ncbi:MAG: hypothetical protein HY209_00025 [Candidatus Omnitrophica bacterium]|nr:hypothetical protein [Candidatus Omnitrophota bacterium]
MFHVLVDDWLYMDIDGKSGIYGRQETGRDLKSKIKTVSAAFLDYQTKIISLADQRSVYQEALVNAAFDGDYIIAQERLSADSIQVIGAKKDKIEEIYRYFKDIRVESLVPYAVAIRAFLKSKGLLDSGTCVIFLDDLKNQAVATFFEGMYFSSPRRISMRDVGYMISEIKRSWQNFLSERSNQNQSSDVPFVLVSNNQQWLSAFVQQGFLSEENIIHVNVDFAVLQGLKSAKFTMHFALAKEILKQKKRQLWKIRLKVLVASSFLILSGLSLYITAKVFEHKALAQYQYLQKQENQCKQRLEMLYQQKFLSLLRQNRPIDYAKVYYDFVRSTPVDYLIDSIQFQKDINGIWQFEGVIYPEDEHTAPADFQRQLSFVKAKVSFIVSNKFLGQQIDLNVNQKGEQL